MSLLLLSIAIGFLQVLLCVTLGFAVAAGTAIILGREKAMKYPGGSLAAGIGAYLAFAPESHPLLVLLGGVLGIGGWIIYREIAKRW